MGAILFSRSLVVPRKYHTLTPLIIFDRTQQRGCHLAAIKKNNMVGKDKDKDRWYTGIRSPYERVFSQRERRVRYRGVAKNRFCRK